MSHLRVTHLITSLDADGTQRMLMRTLAQLGDRRRAMEVISLRPPNGVAAQLEQLEVPVRSLEVRRAYQAPAAALKLVGWLRERRPTVLVSWMYHANLLATAAAAMIPTPTVWNVRHARLHRGDRWLTRGVAQIGARLSHWPTRIVFCSRMSRRWHVLQGYPPHRSTVVPNGFDTQMFRPNREAHAELRRNLGLPPDTLLVGHLGRFHPDKDHHTFLEAAARVATRRLDVQFLLLGRGVDHRNGELDTLINQPRLRQRCHLLGARGDVGPLLAGLDVVICSSTSEAFANVLGEAMACGVPCVATQVGDSPWIVGETGRVVPPRHADAMADACCQLLALSPAERQRLSTRARDRIQSRYHLAEMAERHYEIWCAAAGHRHEQSGSKRRRAA